MHQVAMKHMLFRHAHEFLQTGAGIENNLTRQQQQQQQQQQRNELSEDCRQLKTKGYKPYFTGPVPKCFVNEKQRMCRKGQAVSSVPVSYTHARCSCVCDWFSHQIFFTHLVNYYFTHGPHHPTVCPEQQLSCFCSFVTFRQLLLHVCMKLTHLGPLDPCPS